MKVFHLPDLGEGLPDAEIHAWHVKEGDTVKVDQLLLSVETAKAVVDVPSPYAGKIHKLYAKAGDIVLTGGPLVEIGEGPAAPKLDVIDAVDTGTVTGNIQVGTTILEENAQGLAPAVSNHAGRAVAPAFLAVPMVRMLARQLHVDLTQVKATGPNGHITAEDVTAAAQLPKATATRAPVPEGYEALRGVRRTMAQAMVQSHAEIVPVTLFDEADLHAWQGKQDISVRVLRGLIKACLAEPSLNAWFDTASMSRQLISDINIGLALDSPDGLFVPVIRAAQSLKAKALRECIDRFKLQVKDRSIPKEDLREPSIMLSNFGMLAGRHATPIVVPPLVSILGCGRLYEAVCAVDGKPAVHKVMPLSLTFDHRAITGGEATRFLAILIDDLQQAK